MKKYALFICALLTPCMAFADNLQVTTSKKRISFEQLKAPGSGQDAKGSETVAYQVTVTNKSFKATPVLEARYIFFVERQAIGEKKGTERVEKVAGKASVPEMAAMKAESFMTDDVKLNEAALKGNYFYSGGERVKAKDSVTGIWIKFFDGDQEVGEYVTPTTLKARHKWE